MPVLGLEAGHLEVQVVLELRTEHRTVNGCIMDQKFVSCCLNTSLLPCPCSDSDLALAWTVRDKLELWRQRALW